jgi:hypothetical protein
LKLPATLQNLFRGNKPAANRSPYPSEFEAKLGMAAAIALSPLLLPIVVKDVFESLTNKKSVYLTGGV